MCTTLEVIDKDNSFIIIEGYQDKLREQYAQNHRPQNTTAAASSATTVQASNQSNKSEREMNPQLPKLQAKRRLPKSTEDMKPDFKVTIKQEIMEPELPTLVDFQPTLQTGRVDCNFENAKRPQVLMIEDSSFEMYRTTSVSQPETAFLECSKCPHVVWFSTLSADGMNLAYQKIRMHALLLHPQEGEKKSVSNYFSFGFLLECKLYNLLYLFLIVWKVFKSPTCLAGPPPKRKKK